MWSNCNLWEYGSCFKFLSMPVLPSGPTGYILSQIKLFQTICFWSWAQCTHTCTVFSNSILKLPHVSLCDSSDSTSLICFQTVGLLSGTSHSRKCKRGRNYLFAPACSHRTLLPGKLLEAIYLHAKRLWILSCPGPSIPWCWPCLEIGHIFAS